MVDEAGAAGRGSAAEGQRGVVDDARRQLANALNPSPAAQRREAPVEERIIADRRGRNDSKQPLSPTSLMRSGSPSQPPPITDPSHARQPFGGSLSPTTNADRSQLGTSPSQGALTNDASQIRTSPGQGALANDASQIRTSPGQGALTNDASQVRTSPRQSALSPNDQTQALGNAGRASQRPQSSTQQPFAAGVQPTTNSGTRPQSPTQPPFGGGLQPATNSGAQPPTNPNATQPFGAGVQPTTNSGAPRQSPTQPPFGAGLPPATNSGVQPPANPNATQTFGAGVQPTTNSGAPRQSPTQPPFGAGLQPATNSGVQPPANPNATQPFGVGINPTTNSGARPPSPTQSPFGAAIHPTTNSGAHPPSPTQQPFGAGVQPMTNSGIAATADPDATHLARPKPATAAPAFGQPAGPVGPSSTAVGMRPHSGSQPPPLPGTSGPNRAPTTPPPIPPSSKSAPESSPFGGDTFITDNDYSSVAEPDDDHPPPTRIHAGALADRPFSPPEVLPIPEIPEPSLYKSARYAYAFARARWQRRGAIKQLQIEIRQDTDALDQVLGALGHAARTARVEGRVFTAENSAISDAQERIKNLQKEAGDVEGRKAEENSKFGDIERERNAKLSEAERMVAEAQSELANLEAQRRSLRDKRKEVERRLKTYLQEADKADRLAGSAPLGDQRQEQRRIAEGHRKEAAALEPDRKEIDSRLGAIERPINEVAARLDAGKAELDAAKRSLNDAREGHTHRLAELDAEHKRKTREIGLAEAEIERRLVTLGTLVNLNRIEDPAFTELYTRIDRLRGAITARTTEIEKLTAEREAYDRHTLVRGVATIGGAILLLIALIVIVAALL